MVSNFDFQHFSLYLASRNRNIGIAVAFSVLGVVAGAAAMWFYMKRKSGKPKAESMLSVIKLAWRDTQLNHV